MGTDAVTGAAMDHFPNPVSVTLVPLKKGETPSETVARCYPTLIAARRQSYEALAHCSVAVAELRDASSDPAVFLSKVSARLERAK